MRNIKSISYFLLKWDGLWSVPLMLFVFVVAQTIGSLLYGDAFAPYDPALLQAGLAALILVGAFNMAVWLGMYFNFRAIYKYYLAESSIDFKNLSGWQKITFLFLAYFGLLFALVSLTIALV